MKKDEQTKSEKKGLEIDEVIGKGTYPSVTNNAIKSIVSELGGTATSAYSHPENDNKTPIFSSEGISIHEAQGQVIQPHPAENERQ